jgi:hypothetical protein
VRQEAAEERFRRQAHGFAAVAVVAVAPGEADSSVFTRQDAVIADRHSMRIAAQGRATTDITDGTDIS